MKLVLQKHIVCLDAIRDWMAETLLQLNADTERIIAAPYSAAPLIRKTLGQLSSAVHSNVRNLVIFDQSLLFETHGK